MSKTREDSMSDMDLATVRDSVHDSSEDSSMNDVKEQIREDVFTTEEEAQERAEAIGCSGTHSHSEDGRTIFMPCATHDEYVDKVGRDIAGYGYDKDKDKRKKPKRKKDCSCDDIEEKNFSFEADIKAYGGQDDEENKEYGEFEGYGSVFGNKDLGNDVVEKGAFARSLKMKHPRDVKLLYQHKSDMPIGVFDEIKEDEHGLMVKGRLALKTQAGAEAYELMKMGALKGLSIGFKVNPEKVSYDRRTNKRIIKEVDLMEVSLVTFPMNPKAMIRSVKGEDISIREWENGMRDAFNLSRSEAKVAAGAVHKAFDQRDAENTMAEILEEVKKIKLTLKS